MKAQGYVSIPEGTMLELMAYVDGELEGEAKERIEQLIASDPHARRVVMEMSKLGEEIVRVYDAKSLSAADGIADAVMAHIAPVGQSGAEPRKASSRPPKLLSLQDAREKRIKVVAAIVAAVSLAAGIVLTTHHANQTAPVAANTVKTSAPGLSPPPSAVPAVLPQEPAQIASAGVDVEQVDSPDHEVEVFYLPSLKGNASSVVVWIDDRSTP